MKFLKIGLIAIFSTLFILACSKANNTTNSTNNSTAVVVNSNNSAPKNTNTAPSVPTDELASAKKIFTDDCAKCHKETGTGGETEADGKKFKVPDFTSEKLKADFDEEDWTDIITNGAGKNMPAFGKKLSEADIKNLIKLIRRDFQGK
jgi:mono/diheme cytochrome c family protein